MSIIDAMKAGAEKGWGNLLEQMSGNITAGCDLSLLKLVLYQYGFARGYGFCADQNTEAIREVMDGIEGRKYYALEVLHPVKGWTQLAGHYSKRPIAVAWLDFVRETSRCQVRVVNVKVDDHTKRPQNLFEVPPPQVNGDGPRVEGPGE